MGEGRYEEMSERDVGRNGLMCEGMKYRCGDGYDRQKRWPCTWDECEARPRVVRENGWLCVKYGG